MPFLKATLVAILQNKKPSQADYYVFVIYIVFLLYFLCSYFNLISFKLCLIRSYTGIECPTCHFTRASGEIFSFHFISAFYQNPLVYLILPGIALHWLSIILKIRWQKVFSISKYFPTKLYFITVGLVGILAFINNNWFH